MAASAAAPVAHQTWHRPDHVHGPAVVHDSGVPRAHAHPHAHDEPHQHDPAPDRQPTDPDHGTGSVSHFALAMVEAPLSPSVPAPAEILIRLPLQPYTSHRDHIIRPRSSRGPPA